MEKETNEIIQSRVTMLLSNPFRPDPRVLKEATSLQEAGCKVTILCWDRMKEMLPSEDLDSGVRIVRIQNVPSTYGIGKRQLLRILRFWSVAWLLISRYKPSILHCHDFDTLPLGLAWGKIHRIPVIYDAHEYYAELCKPRLGGFSGKLIFYVILFSELLFTRFASAVITVDEHLADTYRKHNPKILIIGHYPSINLFQSLAPVFTRKELNLVYIGRLSQDRGVLTYLKILRSLLKAGIDTRLTLAGVFTPADEKEIFLSQCPDLVDQIDILGWIPYESVPDLLTKCDVGLSLLQPEPRYIKALPVKVFEYMAAGLPAVVSDFPEISRMISEIACGFLVNPLVSPDQIAGEIINWYQNPTIPAKMGRNGRQAILEKYNWEQLMEELKLLYGELL